MQKKAERIIEDLSKKYNKPKEVIRAIVESQFLCAKQEMIKGEFGNIKSYSNVRFPHIGMFYASPQLINRLYHLIESNKNGKS